MNKMHRFLHLLAGLAVSLICLTRLACAEELSPDAAAYFAAEYPACTILRSDQCGHTAAAVLLSPEGPLFCIAEKQNGEWTMAVQNPDALRTEESITQLYLDTDAVLFWGYQSGQTSFTYSAVKEENGWRVRDLFKTEAHGNGSISEYTLTFHNGLLLYSTALCDENDNFLSVQNYEPVPAAWLEENMNLAVYRESVFPVPNEYYTHSWLNEEATRRACSELFPDYAFRGGCAGKKHLAFMMEKPDGTLVMAACRFDMNSSTWKTALSTPLPEGTIYGYENFSSSLKIGDLLISIGPVDEAHYGVTFIDHLSAGADGDTMFSLGQNWISHGSAGHESHFGNHPWDDLTVIDWSSLPGTFEEALSLMDTSNWAAVCNPNPADRLHLRVKPDKGAKSLGKYYNGTPVQILSTKGEWVQVSIFGVEGWMMKKYLALGDAMLSVEAAFPSRMPLENRKDHYVYGSADAKTVKANLQYEQHDVLVLGIIGEEWYHIWDPEEQLTGYVPQSEWHEGNG